MRGFAVIAILAALISAATAAQAAGCTCAPDPFEKRWGRVTIVFTGTVQSIEEMHEYLRKANANDVPVKVTLKVTESFKGAVKKDETFVLNTSLTRDTCTGHPFEKDVEYLIWAYRRAESTYEAWSLYNMPSGTYDVGGLCGGTKKIDDAAADLAVIRKKLEELPAEKPKGMFEKMFGN